MPFSDKYDFEEDETVVLQPVKWDGEGHLRSDDEGKLNSGGGKGERAQWKIVKQDGNRVRLQNRKTDKFLRLRKDDDDKFVLNCNGDGEHKNGLWNVQHKKEHDEGVVKFESVKHDGKFVAVGKNGDVKVGEGGPWCKFQAWKDKDGGKKHGKGGKGGKGMKKKLGGLKKKAMKAGGKGGKGKKKNEH